MFSRSSKTAAARSKPRGNAGLSLVGAEMAVRGDVASSGQLHIEGRIDGGVRCAGLCQSESGVIAGDIETGEARIGGLVEGNVTAKIVVIESSGRVTGDVAYDTISIAAGARVEGRLARRAALAGGEAPDMLIATAAEAGEAAEGGGLFSGQATRIAAD